MPQEALEGASEFPRLRAGTFIEAYSTSYPGHTHAHEFPRLRAGTFIEAVDSVAAAHSLMTFPRLRAGTFIEAEARRH